MIILNLQPLPSMPARLSEAFVLQTWPFREGDLIVSFLTRDLGKLRGVARAARRPKSNYGSGLERLSQVRMAYFQKENRELVRIDSCEIVQSQFGLSRDFASACALDFSGRAHFAQHAHYGLGIGVHM